MSHHYSVPDIAVVRQAQRRPRRCFSIPMPFFDHKRIEATPGLVAEVRQATQVDVPVVKSTLAVCHFEVGDISDRAIDRAIRLGRLLIHDGTRSICRFYTAAGITHVSELCVPPEYRGRGIGRALLARLPLPIELTCRIENPSNEFYRHLGFVLVDVKVYKKWTVNVWRIK